MPDLVAITQDFFKAIEAEGFEASSRFLADDFVWLVVGRGELQDRMAELSAAMAEHLDESAMKMLIKDAIVQGGSVAVEAESYARLKDGTIYNNKYHFKIIFSGEKIKIVREYNDRRHAEEVWGRLFSPASQK